MWVVDAPLFEPADEATAAGDVAVGGGAWTAVHHAFTSPKPEWIDTFDTDPGAALAYAYDIVCNGNEIGGGSIRIHRARRAAAGLRGDGPRRGGGAGEVRLPARRVRVRRRRRTAASRSAGTGSARCCPARDSIRDVIAFPKTGGGYDPLTGAPRRSPPAQRKEAGIDAAPPPRS